MPGWKYHFDFEPLLAVQNTPHQISQLLRRELITLQIHRQLPMPVDNDRVQRMRHQALHAPEVHSEERGDLFDLIDWPGKEMPVPGIGFPDRGVLR